MRAYALDTTEQRKGYDMELTTNTEPLLIIRLGSKWRNEQEEIETGYLRSGKGWEPTISDLDLADSVRAWWKFSPEKLEDRGIEHVVAYAAGRTRALYRIVNVLGPRPRDGRHALQVERIEEGELFDKVIGDDGMTVPFRLGSANPVKYWPPKGR